MDRHGVNSREESLIGVVSGFFHHSPSQVGFLLKASPARLRHKLQPVYLGLKSNNYNQLCWARRGNTARIGTHKVLRNMIFIFNSAVHQKLRTRRTSHLATCKKTPELRTRSRDRCLSISNLGQKCWHRIWQKAGFKSIRYHLSFWNNIIIMQIVKWGDFSPNGAARAELIQHSWGKKRSLTITQGGTARFLALKSTSRIA